MQCVDGLNENKVQTAEENKQEECSNKCLALEKTRGKCCCFREQSWTATKPRGHILPIVSSAIMCPALEASLFSIYCVAIVSMTGD